jgi:hypothetical protein
MAVLEMVVIALHLQDDRETCGTAKVSRLRIVPDTAGDYSRRRARISISFTLSVAQYRAYE